MSTSPIASRAKPLMPCPRCNSGTKGCSVTEDSLCLCRGETTSDEWVSVTRGIPDSAGFGHYRRKDDDRHKQNGFRHDPRPAFKGKAVTASMAACASTDWHAKAGEYAKNLTNEQKRQHASEFGLPEDALDCLPLLGFNPIDPGGPCLTFTEMDAAGKVVGINRRYSKGKGPDGKDKKAMPGCHRGLTIPTGWRERSGAVFIVEGPTDTAAMNAVALASIGRPSNVGGVDMLAELLRDFPVDREIIVVGENDQKTDRAWPGRAGAESVARDLSVKLKRSVKWSMPPDQYKDVREWVCDFLVGAGESVDCPTYGQEIASQLSESAHELQPATKPGTLQFRFIDSTTLATGDFRPKWIIKGVLVEHQPATIAGPSKGLKTGIMIDEAISIAAGTSFLGTFPVPKPRRVAVVSGESGAGTIQETAKRICAAKGLNLADLRDTLVWCFEDMPTFSDLESMTAFAAEIAKLKAEIVMLDPTYLMLGAVDAKNLFEMGAAFRTVADVLLKAGSTPVLIHHANRQLERGKAMELTDLAYSGLEQFVRQFILINRRVPYQDDGVHELLLRCGGSAGHGGLWNVRIEEGITDANFEGRRWEIKVETMEQLKESREQAHDRQAEEKRDGDRQRFLDAIDQETRAGNEGASRTKLRGRTKFSAAKVKELIEELLEDGVIEPCEFEKTTGHGAKLKVDGWKRVKGEH